MFIFVPNFDLLYFYIHIFQKMTSLGFVDFFSQWKKFILFWFPKKLTVRNLPSTNLGKSMIETKGQILATISIIRIAVLIYALLWFALLCSALLNFAQLHSRFQ